MPTQSHQRTPQVASEQSTPAPTAAPAASNEAAQEALATRQARNFVAISPGTVFESRVEADKLVAHVASLWGQMTAAGAQRAALTNPETPLASFQGSGLAQELQNNAEGIVAQGRWDSPWVRAGSSGVSGEDGLFNSPFGEAQVAIRALVGDVTPIASGTGTASAGASAEQGSRAMESGEVSAGAGGVGAKVGGEREQSATRGTGTGLAMEVPMTAYRGVLAFDCVVRFKRTFGKAEERSGRVVAGECALNTALGLGG